MLIDHIGVIFFPEELLFRTIGRLAFPLFGWMISIGYLHTHNVINYLKRLFIFALALQIPYTAYFRCLDLNIFFTLFLGLLSIYIFDKEENKQKGCLFVLLLAIVGQFINTDYGIYGILTIFFFYIFQNSFQKLWVSQTILNCLYVMGYFLLFTFSGVRTPLMVFLQPVSVLAVVFIMFYNGQRGIKAKYLFYIFYPVHLIVLYGIQKYWL